MMEPQAHIKRGGNPRSGPLSRLRGTHRGQAIILIALGLIILLGFTGLAIDGGSLFFTQRNARNAADAAVLAGTYVMCTQYEDPGRNAAIVSEALRAAAENGFSAAETTVQIEDEITEEPITSYPDKSGYLRVIISTQAPTYFIQIIYSGPTEVTADSIGLCQPERVAGPADIGILALSKDACRAFENNGTGYFESNAGVWVNSSKSKPPDSCDAAYLSGTSSTVLCEPGLNSVGSAYYEPQDPGGGYYTDSDDTCEEVGDDTVNTGVEQIDDPLAGIDPPWAACAGTLRSVDHAQSDPEGDPLYINPGHYSLIKATSGTVILRPGIYCIDSPTANHGLESVGGQFIGDGVMIFLKRGSFTLSANVVNDLRAPTDTTCFDNSFGTGTCDWRGMLLYSFQGEPYGNQSDATPSNYADGTNANGAPGSDNVDISVAGSGGTNFTGTVYAPFNHCKIVGNSGTIGLNSQFICETVFVAGDGEFYLNYEPSLLYHLPPTLSLVK